jgi:prophage regulatory protein
MRLVGAHEIRMLLGGVSRQRVYQLTSRPDFPHPIADLAQGKVWAADDVETWIKRRPTRDRRRRR